MSLIMEALTAESPKRKGDLIHTLMDTSKDGLLHESFDKQNHSDITREWFAWPNALFAELVQSTGNCCGTLEQAPKMPNVQQRQPFSFLRPTSPKNFYTADVKTLRYREIPELGLLKA